MIRKLSVRSATARALFSAAILFAATALDAQVTPPTAPVPPVTPDTSYVDYDEGPISLPLGIGLRIPSYNRVDGLVIPWGPVISLFRERLKIDPTVTYRSHIGKVDPFVTTQVHITPSTRLEIAGGRSTFTNDGWIRSDIINSAAALGVGSDSRNYFRADRGWALLSQEILAPAWIFTPSIGALTENDWSTGSPVAHTNAPWSFFGKTDRLKMRRPNPAIQRGHVSSALGRVKAEYEREAVKATIDVALERAFDKPPTLLGSHRDTSGDFTQLTLGSKVTFPTFRDQWFDFRGHALLTPGGVAPPQRFGYLGGAGTLATVDLLALGGDRLLYVEGEYSIPLAQVQLPLVGPPVVSLRYAAGAAGVGELPDFIQNLGVGLGVKFLKAEYHIDPNYKKTPFSRKHATSIGVSLSL